MSKIKGDKIIIQSLHQTNGKQFRSEESSKKPFKACYRCGKLGHFKRDCQAKVVCDRCEKPDHIKPNCRVKIQESEANAVHESKNSSDSIWEYCLTTEILDQPTNVTLAVYQDDVSTDFELTFDDLDAFEADDFLISEDLDQTTNLLDLQADQEASRGTVVHVCSFACSPGSGSSAVSCKQSPNEGEFLDYQSSELRTADSECFSTHSGGWDSKSLRIVNFPSLEHSGSGSDHEFSVELDPKSTNPQLSSWL